MSESKDRFHAFVEKKDLTTTSLSPTSLELYDMMFLLSCDEAVTVWKDRWLLCPVCNQPYRMEVDMNRDILVLHPHKAMKDLIT